MSQKENLLLRIQGLFFFMSAFAGIFLTIFLFKLGGFEAVIRFDLINIIFLFLFYALSILVLKRFSSKTLIRIGLLSFGMLYTALFVLQEHSLLFLVPLGMLSGVGNGTYWSGSNLSRDILTHKKTRNQYFGEENFLLGITSAIGPLLGGLIIYSAGILGSKDIGYAFIFLLVALCMFYAYWDAGALPAFTHISFSFPDFIKEERTLNWRIVLLQQFLVGLWDTAFTALSVILIFFIVKGEFSLGLFNMIAMIVMALASILGGRVLSKNKNLYILGAILAPLGLFLFGYFQNWIALFGFIFLFCLFWPFLNVIITGEIFDEMDGVRDDWHHRYHFFIVREGALSLGRITTYLVLLSFLTFYNEVNVVRTWVMIISVIPILIGLLQFYQYRHKKALKS